jgi:hypothetical protein
MEGYKINRSFLAPMRELSTMDDERSFRVKKGHINI